MKKVVGFVILAGAVCFQGCKKDDDPVCTTEIPATSLSYIDKAKLKSDSLLIVDYLASKEITDAQILNNVFYRVEEMGNGALITCFENGITVKYKGRLLKPNPTTGVQTVFDTTVDPNTQKDVAVTFALNNLILGWKAILPAMPVGSKFTMYIPSGYGYGVSGSGGVIPSHANLIFDIEFVAIP